jgi:oligopeptide transport system substrate-binding protein
MKNWKSTLAGLLSVSLLLSALTACGGSSSSDSSSGDSSSESAATEESAAGESAATESEASQDSNGLNLAADQTLNILLSATINTLDPNGASWTGEAQIISQTQAGLLRITTDDDGNNEYTLDGAESYTISDDGLVYTFQLRDNYWSDGQLVTADDYVYSFLRNLDPENGFSTSQYLDVLNAQAYYDGEVDADQVGVKALDDHTVEYTLEAPNSEFLYYLAEKSGFPARQDVVEAATSTYGTDISEMVFCGPFKVTSWVKENSVTLEKNDSYWDADNVILQTVNMQYVAEASTQATLFDAQQLDIVSYNDDYGAEWEEQAENGEINYINRTGVYSDFLVFAIENGGKSGLMGNANIRKALSLAIDRQELVDTVWGRYEAAYTYVPSAVPVGTSVYNVAGEGLVKDQQEEYSTDESLQQLFQQGLEELGKDTDLSQVSIDFVVEASNVSSQTQAEYIAQTWQNRLGIQVVVDVTTDAEERQNQMDYDVGVNGWEGGASPYDYLFVVNVPYGLKYLTGVYTNEEVNELLSTVTSIADEQEQAEVFHQIENIILDEAGVGPLYFTDVKYFTQTYVGGVEFPVFGPAIEFSRAYILAE